MVGVLYIYNGENFKCVLRHMEDQFICTGTERFFKKQLLNLKVKI